MDKRHALALLNLIAELQMVLMEPDPPADYEAEPVNPNGHVAEQPARASTKQ